jgi:hypothetical protein
VAALSSPARADHALTVLLVDSDLGLPTAARLSVTGSDQLPYRPAPDSLSLFHEPLGGYFYADSASVVLVPDGSTFVRASKGLEYLPYTLTLPVVSDTTITVSLDRWIEPRTLGWVGGDTHGDLTHPPAAYHPGAAEASLVMKAEGLRVATFLDNGFLFTGQVNDRSAPDATFFSAEEYRSPTFGHAGLLGIGELVDPDWGYPGWPLNGEVVEQVRGMGHALATVAHPLTTRDFFDTADWPGTGLARGVWVDAANGLVDAIDVLSYSNEGAEGYVADSLWSDLWNAGFAVPGLAGTDACLGRLVSNPLGALRVYVRVPDPYAPPAALYDSWIEGARRGRTFVTTGPLLTEFEVGEAGPGETLDVSAGMPVLLPLHARFESAWSLRRIEVIVNGAVVETHDATGLYSYDLDTEVPVRETSWIAVRHDGVHPGGFHPATRAFAQPTPILVRLEGDALTSASSASRALLALERLDSLLGEIASYPSPEESLAVAAGIASARDAWTSRSNAAPAPFHLESPCYACLLTDPIPLFSWEPGADPDSSGALTYRFVLAADEGFQSILIDTSGLAAPTWSPDAPLTTGERYWWRVRAEDGAGARRWAEEADWWFEPAVPTGSPAASGRPALALAITPNPARADRGGVLFTRAAPLSSMAEIRVFNAEGREIRSFHLAPGAESVHWDGTDRGGKTIPNGVYLYRAESNGEVRTGKICFIR